MHRKFVFLPASIFLAAIGGCGIVLGIDEYQRESADEACKNGIRDGSETDVDCGGSCAACPAGKGCVGATDCETLVCTGTLCQAPSCSDVVKNGDETDVDCGGPCAGCPADGHCATNDDCASQSCISNVCVASCDDGVRDGNETDVDCGGPDCVACPVTAACATGSDCESGVCKSDACADFHVWSERFGDDFSTAVPAGVALLSNSDIVLAGNASGGPNFGGGQLLCGRTSVYVARFDAAGKHGWSKCLGDWDFYAMAGQAVVDASDDIVFAGYFDYQASFGGPLLKTPCMAADPQNCDSDAFVAKLSAAGSHVWSKNYGDAQNQRATGVTVTSSGDVVTVGHFLGSIKLTDYTLTSAGGNDLFFAKLDGATGTGIWSFRMGDALEQKNIRVAVDTNDNVLIGGSYFGSMQLGAATVTSAGDEDVFVGKISGTGAVKWIKSFGDASAQNASDVAVDPQGNIYVAGSFDGAIDFGGSCALSSAGGGDAYIAKLDPNGACLWARAYGDADEQRIARLATDAGGNVLLTGQFKGDIDLGNGLLTSAGGFDVFIAKLDPSGKPLWVRRFGDAADQFGGPIAPVGMENALVSGSFKGFIDLGGTSLESSVMGTDTFLAKLLLP